MRRYEQPAYRAAYDFLEAVKSSQPHLAAIAQSEQDAIQQAFTEDYGGRLV